MSGGLIARLAAYLGLGRILPFLRIFIPITLTVLVILAAAARMFMGAAAVLLIVMAFCLIVRSHQQKSKPDSSASKTG